MTEELLKILCELAQGKSIQKLDPLLEELITIYMGDLNSSTLREQITAKISGYKILSGKHGRDCIDEKSEEEKEIKPKLFTKDPTNGSGCFSDYTRNRYNKDKESNLKIVHSLFVKDRLQYIVEFSFDAIANELDKQIYEKCEVNKNPYVRSASWTYKNWITHDSLKFHYFDKEQIEENNPTTKKSVRSMSGPFKKLLIQKYEQSIV